MDNMEEKLGSILNDPQMMQQIMALAQSLSQSQPMPAPESTQTQDPSPAYPQIDPNMLKSLSAMAGGGTIDRNQQSLLKALSPYLSQERIRKLEKAMRAAKIASLASGFLNQGGLSMLTGR